MELAFYIQGDKNPRLQKDIRIATSTEKHMSSLKKLTKSVKRTKIQGKLLQY